jgi:hypothetical protein
MRARHFRVKHTFCRGKKYLYRKLFRLTRFPQRAQVGSGCMGDTGICVLTKKQALKCTLKYTILTLAVFCRYGMHFVFLSVAVNTHPDKLHVTTIRPPNQLP